MGEPQISYTSSNERERIAALGLWAVPGVGPVLLDQLRSVFGGSLSPVLDLRLEQWAFDPRLRLSVPVRQRLALVRSFEELAQEVEADAADAGIGICFPGDAAYPRNLVNLADSPPLLFHWGQPQGERRRVAMVGSRRPDGGFALRAHGFAREIASAGVTVVSGAAEGIDTACHRGAIDAGMESWAFVGSALDELDSHQRRLAVPLLEQGGVLYSEFPPGVRANKQTFPRRNRLISGASDAVLVLRAGKSSGAIHTAKAAYEHGRPLLAMPGEVGNEAAVGCNELIAAGFAKACLSAADVFAAVGLDAPALVVHRTAPKASAELSPVARRVYDALSREARVFEELEAATALSSAELTSALIELELAGLAMERAGKRYEKV